MGEIKSASQSSELVKVIDKNTIKYLSAGEKINDIVTTVRELVENSVDAGAKNIEVRLSKFGVDAIEVEDNGKGIDERNFAFLGMRYYTSKISDVKDLQDSLYTFGFRGEALSCLCSIANVYITTHAKVNPCGYKLTYKDGTLIKQEKVHRDVGTTVIVKNLFHSMPVRRRELETTAKKQYDKIVRVLYEHALARPHIKFSLSKKTAARKEKDFTHGDTNLEGCLVTIFGVKLMDTILAIRQDGQQDNTLKDEKGKKTPETILPIHDESQPDDSSTKANGKQATQTHDCDIISNPTSVSDSNASIYEINAASDTCNSDGSTNIDTNIAAASLTTSFTQSVAPSRDQIFFKRERKSRFARERPCYTIYGYISKIVCGKNSSDQQYIFVNNKPCEIPRITRLLNDTYRHFSASNQYPFVCLFIEVQRWAIDFNVPRKREVILQEEQKLFDLLKETIEAMYAASVPAAQKSCPIAQIPMISKFAGNNDKQGPKTNESMSHSDAVSGADIEGDSSKTTASGSNGVPRHIDTPAPVQQSKSNSNGTEAGSGNVRFDFESVCNDVVDSIPDLFEIAPKRARISSVASSREPLKNKTSNDVTNTGFRNGLDLLAEEANKSNCGNDLPMTCDSSNEMDIEKQPSNALVVINPLPRQKNISPKRRADPPPEPVCKFDQHAIVQDNHLKVSVSFFEDLPAALERERSQQAIPHDARNFSYAIAPQFNTPAEDELKCHLNKSSFTDMQVIGQFNRGFIIAKLNKHLFIIDQHATDERANYEEQLEMSPLVSQPMVHPKPLYMSLIQENAILNHLDAFIKRGFQFKIDMEKPSGYKVMLSGTSICRGPDREEHLGKDDVEELVDVCIESPNRLDSYILSKVKTVSASIACRKSVMIGDKLTWSKMDTIVNKMSNLQNPWICAHNRPTIRHLMDTDWMDSAD